MFTTICTVKADIPEPTRAKIVHRRVFSPKHKEYYAHLAIILRFGPGEVTAQISWDQDVSGRRILLQISSFKRYCRVKKYGMSTALIIMAHILFHYVPLGAPLKL